MKTRVLTSFIVFVGPVLLEPTVGCTCQREFSGSSAPDRRAELDKQNNETSLLSLRHGSDRLYFIRECINGWVRLEQQGKLISHRKCSTVRVGLTCSIKYNKANVYQIVYLISPSAVASGLTVLLKPCAVSAVSARTTVRPVSFLLRQIR